jgi:hypothetical protein
MNVECVKKFLKLTFYSHCRKSLRSAITDASKQCTTTNFILPYMSL